MSRVFDKNGHELTVGARVRDTLIRRPRFWLAYAHVAEDSWRTPGLLLIDSPSSNHQTTEKAASAAPKGAA
jgi:hypothetical protein